MSGELLERDLLVDLDLEHLQVGGGAVPRVHPHVRGRPAEQVSKKRSAKVREREVTSARCCGSGMFIPDPESDFLPSRIPDPNFFHPGSASKNLNI